jgi:hypothetical protein
MATCLSVGRARGRIRCPREFLPRATHAEVTTVGGPRNPDKGPKVSIFNRAVPGRIESGCRPSQD